MEGAKQTHVIEIEEKNWEEILKEHSVVLADFWANWCGPCRALMPIIEDLATDNVGRAAVAKINVDDNMNLQHRYKVRSIPTLILFKNGQEVERIVGAQSKAELQVKLDKYV